MGAARHRFFQIPEMMLVWAGNDDCFTSIKSRLPVSTRPAPCLAQFSLARGIGVVSGNVLAEVQKNLGVSQSRGAKSENRNIPDHAIQ